MRIAPARTKGLDDRWSFHKFLPDLNNPRLTREMKVRRIRSAVPNGQSRQMSNLDRERVLDVRHWTENLFSFSTSRSPTFRFQSGQFTMIGLDIEGKPLLRAYSMASAHHEDTLEFFSIKVQDGPLTSRLQHLKP